VAWSLWSLPGDGNWQGLLYVAEGPGRTRQTLAAGCQLATR